MQNKQNENGWSIMGTDVMQTHQTQRLKDPSMKLLYVLHSIEL